MVIQEELSSDWAVDATSCSSEALFSLVYAELRKLAESRLKHETPGQTLQPTALVHEVYLRLVVPLHHQSWENSGHFFAAAAQAMRRILIDHARKKIAAKRGGGHQRVDVQLDDLQLHFDDERLLRLDEALSELAVIEPLKAKLIELRFFTGLSDEQTCHVLEISRATAHRYWTQAKAWLFLKLRDA